MQARIGFSLLLFWLMTGVALAHGPTHQEVVEQITIDAPPAKVWAAIKDFGDVESLLPMVERSESAGGNEPGATRTLYLKGGGELHEVLKRYEPDRMRYAYRIPMATHDVHVLPVSNYSSTLSVDPAGQGHSLVTWKGAFYRGYMNNNPPPSSTTRPRSLPSRGSTRRPLRI